MSVLPPLDVIKEVRPRFPALAKFPSFCFADNAGGSQILDSSLKDITDYLVQSNVQLGGGYSFSQKAAEVVEAAKRATAILTNVDGGVDQVVFGSSTTQLISNLAHACGVKGKTDAGVFELGDEIIVTAADHEANVGPWIRLAKSLGLTIKYWLPTPLDPTNPFSLHLDPTHLTPLLTGHTRLVAFTAKSNLLGHGTNVKAVVDLVRARTGGRGMTVVDCVAACPHVIMDMKAWGCDAVMFSHYKLFGPHLSSLIISPSSPLSTFRLSSLGHYFHPQTVSSKLAPGGAPYELQVGCSAILPYLVELGRGGEAGGGQSGSSGSSPEEEDRKSLVIAYNRIKAHEAELSRILLNYLTSDEARSKGVKVVGPEGIEGRAPTISFMVVHEVEKGVWRKKVDSREIVRVFDEEGKIGIKYGHFYATRIIPCLPLQTESHSDAHAHSLKTPEQRSEPPLGSSWDPRPDPDGVVRISLVHYNTVDEVEGIVEGLKRVLSGV